VVIVCAQPTPVLVLFDACDVDDERNPRHVVELQSGVFRIALSPFHAIVRLDLRRQVEIHRERTPGQTCCLQVRDV
jgi:hypothetical protein